MSYCYHWIEIITQPSRWKVSSHAQNGVSWPKYHFIPLSGGSITLPQGVGFIPLSGGFITLPQKVGFIPLSGGSITLPQRVGFSKQPSVLKICHHVQSQCWFRNFYVPKKTFVPLWCQKKRFFAMCFFFVKKIFFFFLELICLLKKYIIKFT